MGLQLLDVRHQRGLDLASVVQAGGVHRVQAPVVAFNVGAIGEGALFQRGEVVAVENRVVADHAHGQSRPPGRCSPPLRNCAAGW